MELQRIFNEWAHSVQKKYARQQWLLSKWEIVDGIIWPPQKQKIMLNSILEGLSLEGRETLADLGCGGGWILKALKEKVKTAVGVDFSMGMLSNVSEIMTDALLVCGEIGRLPFKSETFDRAVSYYVFLNCNEDAYIERSILEIMRILKPGGCALLGQLPDKERSSDYEQAKESYVDYCQNKYELGKDKGKLYKPPLRLFDKDKLAAFFKREGIQHHFRKSFNPFYREGEPELIDWRFDLVLQKR